MINLQSDKTLLDRLPDLAFSIREHEDFYEHNEEVLDIYEGNLLPYVKELMQCTLDKRYYSQIQHRILPINFLKKIVDKLSKSYADEPVRMCEEQEFVDRMANELDVDSVMMLAEEYSHLNRGYALKPKLTNKGEMKLEAMPYDQFFVKSYDDSDKMNEDVFVEFLGKQERKKVIKGKDEIVEMDCFIAYSDTEIMGFESDGTFMPEVAKELNYTNPIGQIPFIYANRSNSSLIPKQDTDFLTLAKVLPLMLSDINGAIMFQCFTLIYGIDVEFNDATYNPNAIWDLSSKSRNDRPGTVGTLEPSVDSDKALNFFKNIIGFWLDSKGIDNSAIINMSSNDIASGFSKAMDEIDTTEARKKSIKSLTKEEKKLFILLAKMNNYWRTTEAGKDLGLLEVDVKKVMETISIEFKEPMPKLDISTEIKNSVEMLDNGLSYQEKEIKRLHPFATEEEIDLMFLESGRRRLKPGDSQVNSELKELTEININQPDEDNNDSDETEEEENERR